MDKDMNNNKDTFNDTISDNNKDNNNNNKDNINNNNFVCVLDTNDPSLFNLGVQSLKNNNFAVVILAGGQGSRLGSDLPKALYKLNGKSLIDYHIERIIKIQEDYGCSITLFIMVSSFTENETKKYLQNNNFNLKIEIIKQEDRECKKIGEDQSDDMGNDNSKGDNGKGKDINDHNSKGKGDKDHNIKDDSKGKDVDNNINNINNINNTINNISLFAPGGNGDVFKSLSNINLDHFVCINIISVDNVLAKVLDPNFVGGFIKNNLEILSKAVKKRENENVGVFEIKREGLRIKEYDGSKDDSSKDDGSKLGKYDGNNIGKDNIDKDKLDKDANNLNLNNHLYGNICNHLFSPSFIKKMTKIPLKEHSVLKKIPFLKDGQWVKPLEPNGYKTETFIFDCFEYATRNGFIKVKREEEFAPLKNGNESKEDNPRTCEEVLKKMK